MERVRKGVITKDTPGIKVVHTMADGSVRDSVQGYLTDYDAQLPDAAKYLLIQFIRNGQKSLAEKERKRREQEEASKAGRT